MEKRKKNEVQKKFLAQKFKIGYFLGIFQENFHF